MTGSDGSDTTGALGGTLGWFTLSLGGVGATGGWF